MTDYQQFNYSMPIDDDRDTVVYGKEKHKHYWKPETKHYRLFEGRSKSMIWHKFNYKALMDGKMADIGRLLLIMQQVDADNMICTYDKKIRKIRPIRNKEELTLVAGYEAVNGRSREFLKRLFSKDIVKKLIVIPNTQEQKKIERYFLNPLITMQDKGISLMCYKLFREQLVPVIGERAVANLDKHLLEDE